MFNFFFFDKWFKQNLNVLFKKNRIYIFFSGGCNSSVLLEFFCKVIFFFNFYRIFVVYVNHGIFLSSIWWQQHIVNICAFYNVPLLIIQITLLENIFKNESIYRIIRQIVYTTISKNFTQIIIAQHADDQLETFFQKFFRGTSFCNCGCMRLQLIGTNFYLFRPFLHIPSSCLTMYFFFSKILCIFDTSNIKCLFFLRNFLRIKVLRLLKSNIFSIIGQVLRFNLFYINNSRYLLFFVLLKFKFLKLRKQIFFMIEEYFLIKSYMRINLFHFLCVMFFYIYPSLLLTKCFEKFLLSDLKFNFLNFKELFFIKNEFYINIISIKVKIYFFFFFYSLNYFFLIFHLYSSYYYRCYFFLNIYCDFLIKEQYEILFYKGVKDVSKIFDFYKIPYEERLLYPLVYFRNKLIGICGIWYCRSYYLFRIFPILFFCFN